MKTFTADELKEILRKHELWLQVKEDGVRADLSYADLSYADLSYADLSYANLRSANLSYADLSSADLRSADLSSANLSSANLSYADLRSANLSYADLSSAKEDLFSKLEPLKSESLVLYKAVVDGKIDGSCYEGECCCFVGTIAKNMDIKYQEMENLKPDSSSPIERFFMAINRGDTPENNPVSIIVKDWLEEFMNTNGIKIPERKVEWV